MDNFEEQWSIALKKGKQRTSKQTLVPLSIQKKQLEEEMSYYKDKLKKVCHLKNPKLTEETVKTLIKLRARQVGIQTQEMQAVGTPLTKFHLKRLASAYADDCAKILKAVEILSK